MKLPPLYFLAALGLFAGAASAQTTVLFLGTGGGADAAIQSYLEGRYGKANVTFDKSGTISNDTLGGYDVAVLSSTPSSGRYRGKVQNSTTPIVNMEEAVADNGGGEFSITTGRPKETETGAHSIKISADHPITKGFKKGSTVQITTGAAEVWWSTLAQAAGSTSLAADDDTATNLFITIVDQGGTLLNNSKAPCRRVMFGMTDNSFNFFSKEGKQIFGQAVDWASDACCAQRFSYGAGLKGTNNIPTIASSADPKIGATINVAISNSSGKSNNAVLFMGLTPISVKVLGGAFLVSPFFEAPLVLPAAGLTIPYKIPNIACNSLFYLQVLQLDTGAAQGVSFTAGHGLKVGN